MSGVVLGVIMASLGELWPTLMPSARKPTLSSAYRVRVVIHTPMSTRRSSGLKPMRMVHGAAFKRTHRFFPGGLEGMAIALGVSFICVLGVWEEVKMLDLLSSMGGVLLYVQRRSRARGN